MGGLFDRLGKAAQQTAAEGKLRLDIRNLTVRLDERAQALGYLMYRQHRGESIPDEDYVSILDEMVSTDSERQAKEVELEDLRRPAPAVAPAASVATAAPAAAAAPATMTCSCGAVWAVGTRFCSNCGSSLAAE